MTSSKRGRGISKSGQVRTRGEGVNEKRTFSKHKIFEKKISKKSSKLKENLANFRKFSPAAGYNFNIISTDI